MYLPRSLMSLVIGLLTVSQFGCAPEVADESKNLTTCENCADVSQSRNITTSGQGLSYALGTFSENQLSDGGTLIVDFRGVFDSESDYSGTIYAGSSTSGVKIGKIVEYSNCVGSLYKTFSLANDVLIAAFDADTGNLNFFVQLGFFVNADCGGDFVELGIKLK